MKILRLILISGSIALFYCILRPFPLLSAGQALLSVLLICLSLGIILFRAEVNQPVTAMFLLTSLIPWLLVALFLANGAFDHSSEVRHPATVVETQYGLTWDLVVVNSWRPGRAHESLYMKTPIFFGRSTGIFLQGEPLSIGIKSGAFGIPWISSISRIPARMIKKGRVERIMRAEDYFGTNNPRLATPEANSAPPNQLATA